MCEKLPEAGKEPPQSSKPNNFPTVCWAGTSSCSCQPEGKDLIISWAWGKILRSGNKLDLDKRLFWICIIKHRSEASWENDWGAEKGRLGIRVRAWSITTCSLYTFLHCLGFLLCVYIHFLKLFFFEEGRLWSQTVWESGSISCKLCKLRQVTETLQASGFSWVEWISLDRCED